MRKLICLMGIYLQISMVHLVAGDPPANDLGKLSLAFI